ncbi:MAG: hypothetical protein WD059_00020 [Balneolaceae bacterium]
MKEFTLQKYRDLGAILTDSFVYIRIHYKTLGKGLLFFVLPFYLVSGALVGNAYSSIFSAAFNDPENMDMMIGGDFWLGILLLALASGSLFTVTLKHMQLARNSDTIETMDLLEDFGRNFLTLLGLYFLVIFAVGFSFLLLIIPGIYVGIKVFVSPTVAILEKRNPFEAISRSWDLVEGHWWFTFAVYLVMYFITTFMSYVLIIPFSIFLAFMSASGVDAASGGLGTSMGIFYGLLIVVASLFSVLLLIAMSLHYFNLVERKEGKGLRSQIEELAQGI